VYAGRDANAEEARYMQGRRVSDNEGLIISTSDITFCILTG
jgi:hypothetical protein